MLVMYCEILQDYIFVEKGTSGQAVFKYFDKKSGAYLSLDSALKYKISNVIYIDDKNNKITAAWEY